MIEYWQTQRSGDLEKTAILAAELGFDFSEAGLHKLSISLLIETIPQVDNTLVKLELLEQLADSQFIDGQLVNAEKTAKQIIHTSQDIENMTWAVKGNILMGKIYFQKGQFDTSLNYFNQSLALAQEAGNREQEGAALNNISQIYDARGDCDKALGYLEQSLVIRQEIGDVSGLCATLFNMGHIYLQNNEFKKAIATWLKVYEQAKEIKLAQALEALEGLAEGLGLSGGLQGWEELLIHSKNDS